MSKENAASGEAVAKTATAEKRSESPPRRAMRLDEGGSMLEKLVGKPKTVEAAVPKKETSLENKKEDEEPMEVEEKSEVVKGEVPKAKVEEPHSSSDEEEDVPAVLHYVGDQNAVVYFADDMAREKKSRHPSDSFFDLTVDEVKRRQKELKEESDRLTGGEALTTKGGKEAQREAGKMATLVQYKRTVVRVQFPDRTVLQAAFLSGAKVGEVREFVRKFLRSDLPEGFDFELFVAPPKKVLSDSSTLLDAGLVPMAVVFFGPKYVSTLIRFA